MSCDLVHLLDLLKQEHSKHRQRAWPSLVPLRVGEPIGKEGTLGTVFTFGHVLGMIVELGRRSLAS